MSTTPEKVTKKKFKVIWDFLEFYFSPKVRSVLTIPHFIVWSYIGVYYLDYVVVSVQFFVYTLVKSNVLLSFPHLLWGIALINVFAFPYVMANYAIFVVYHVWTGYPQWSNYIKWAATIIAIISVFIILFLLDDVARFVAGQNELRGFMQDIGLNGRI